MEDSSELWRGVVHNFAGKYLGEKTIRGATPLECQERLTGWFERWFPQPDVSLTCHRLVAVGPTVLIGKRPRPLEPDPVAQRPLQRSTPWQTRYR